MATAPRRAAPARSAPAAAQPASGRGRPASPSSRAARTGSPVRASTAGEAAIDAILRNAERAEAEQAAREATPLMPFRFFTPVGETKEIIIVDDKPSFVRNEHCLQDRRTKRWDVYIPCIDEVCNCPACSTSERPPYFAMYLTVVDNNPYVNADGEEVPFSKKLLVVKPMQQKKIMRFYQREGTLRGMILSMTRDNKKDANIGDPEFVGFAEESELQGYVYDYTDKEGEVHEVLCDEPYDYEALFPDMSEQQIAALVGGAPASGSRHADDRALGRTRGRAAPEEYGDDDQGGWDGGGGRRVATRRAPAAREAAEDVEYQEEPAAPAPRRAPSRPLPPAAAPAAAPARGRRAAPVQQETIHPDDLPDAGADDGSPPFDTDPEPAPTRSARPAPRRATPAPAPEPTAAPRPSMAARRSALRR